MQLDVIDVSGRLVNTLVRGSLDEGRHEVGWDGVEAGGRPAAAGVYFYRLITAQSVMTRRMVLTR